MTIFPIEQSAQRAVLAVSITFSFLTFLFVGLRLLSHRIARKPWTLSDYLTIAAAILAISLQGISITGVFRGGIGWGHVPEVVLAYGPEPITLLLKLVLPLQFLWVLSLSLSKISILLLYIRVFPVAHILYIAYITIGIITAWAIATILAGCLICQPISMNWNPAAGGSCGDQVLSFTVTGAINLVTDAIVLLLPLPTLYQLQLKSYKKFTLIGVFSLGTVTCIISGLRISVLSTMDFEDITYSIPLANIFSCLEPCIAIILSCVPLLRPLLGHTFMGSTPSSSATNGASSKPRTSDRAFQPLDDDSSQYKLRPQDHKHAAEVSAVRPSRSHNDDLPGSSDQDSLELRDLDSGRVDGDGRIGITVSQGWEVSNNR